MSKDVAERLDALAHDYREGRLTLASYRNLRAPLLDLLTSQPGLDSADRSVTTQRGRAARTRNARRSAVVKDERPARRGFRLAVAVAAIASMVAAAVAMYPKFRDAPADASGADETSQTLGGSDDWSSERM